MIPFRFGNVLCNVSLPPGVLADSLPFYIRSFEGDVLPRFEARIRIAPPGEAPPGAADLSRRFGFHLASLARSGCDYHVYAAAPVGPARPDELPVRIVIPSLFAALSDAGVAALHASAVLVGDAVVLVAGRSGAGKSTTARNLVEMGCNFFADDRVLVWQERGRLVATPSFERPNPFCRWVGRVPGSGETPLPRPDPPYGTRGFVERVYVAEIRADEPSALAPVSPAQAHALLSTACAGEWPFSPCAVPVARLTLGRDPRTVLARIRDESFSG